MNILLMVTGSIAAYKAADLANGLRKKGHNVHVAMSASATEFITPLTMQTMSKNIVHLDVMEERDPLRIEHVDLIKEMDVILIAPASANIIGKLANGIADDMVSTLGLIGHELPMYIAPAMNTRMIENPIVIENMERLKKHGVQFIEPRSSELACQDVGRGALEKVDKIIEIIEKIEL